ncbi:MAG: hypothetical protein LBT40_08730 [Deltaproteobacteria bacterium]|nr:hypothetical protein [Deltaproteobacteria bacterium]
MSRERVSVDEAWKNIFEEHSVPERTRGDGVFLIDAREINRHHEARLMAKFDTSAVLPEPFKECGLSILPVGRGRYALGRFRSYCPVPAFAGSPRSLPEAMELETLTPANLYSEAAAVLFAWNAGLVTELCGGKRAALTVNGRMSSGTFPFRIGTGPAGGGKGKDRRSPSGERAQGRWSGKSASKAAEMAGLRPRCLWEEPSVAVAAGVPGQVELQVENAQVEIDAGFETEDAFYVLEAKSVMSGELLVRQLYYPWRLWGARIRKPVIPVFMVLSNDIYSFYVYAFDDPGRYDSIRLERTLSFRLGQPSPRGDLDALTRGAASLPPEGVPFPQADSLERVVDLLGVLTDGDLLPDELTLRYGFDRRQTSYYLAACAWLGLVEKEGGFAGHGGAWSLSEEGLRAMALPPEEKRLALAAAVLGRPVFREVWRMSFDSGSIPGDADVAPIVARDGTGMAPSTAERRSRTVRSWIGTIMSWASG